MKIIRILVYEGEDKWMEASLGSQRTVQGVFGGLPKGRIQEYFIQGPLYLPTNSPFDIEPLKKESK